MARRTFFSFHYRRDVWRANVVRNSAAGFWDSSLWNEVPSSEWAIQRAIDQGLERTSVTVILIGAYTAERQWVHYEIEESLSRGNGIVGIYINGIRDSRGRTDRAGPNPLDEHKAEDERGRRRRLSDLCGTYDWVEDGGYRNLADWIEDAAQDVGR